MTQPQHVVSSFGRLADDFFVSILLLKSADEVNFSLPFLHAHVLELSAKAACYKLSVSLTDLKNGHDISAIYQRLVPHLLGLFRVCRDAYADTDQNRRLKGKVSRVFGQEAQTDERLHQLIGI